MTVDACTGEIRGGHRLDAVTWHFDVREIGGAEYVVLRLDFDALDVSLTFDVGAGERFATQFSHALARADATGRDR
ncbi:hypothetical protein MBEHAL_0551 [Halarchaeum acidiphilum MH1-52-1]|uniref:Uncharacterized protein n=1 Tax=Halarchaeum acidiphilum MH1-52-1 TaxID=1261545 RepID=U2YDN1_9EURY|nr:hypothetical protein [Halarchaeum acidiphilum]GAD51791.1 hypothetical protein MBEHAL_0551 [Halarchaeum acidiphilum MH1-52-1]